MRWEVREQAETLGRTGARHWTSGAWGPSWPRTRVQRAGGLSGTGSREGAGPGGPAAAPTNQSRSRCHVGWGCWETSCGCPGRCPWGRCRRRSRCDRLNSRPLPHPRTPTGSWVDSAPERGERRGCGQLHYRPINYKLTSCSHGDFPCEIAFRMDESARLDSFRTNRFNINNSLVVLFYTLNTNLVFLV